MNNFFQDLRYALRTLSKNPGFAVVAVLTLALGIGANTAIYALVESALLRPMPYPEPERLMHPWETSPRSGNKINEFSYPNFLDHRAQARSFEGLAGFNQTAFLLPGAVSSEQVNGAMVTSNFFQVLRIQPLLGRAFKDGEDQFSTSPVAVLSYGCWQRRFAADPNIIGKPITLDGKSASIIGVLPPQFYFALVGRAEIWTPFTRTGDFISRRSLHWVHAVGRLSPGVSMQQAQTEMSGIAQRLAVAYPAPNGGAGIRVLTLRDQIVGDLRPAMLVLFAAVAFVLLIACANVANLLLVRAASREREIAIRAAIGASRMQLMRQLFVESILLSLLGASGGMLLAMWGVDVLIPLIPPNFLFYMPYLDAARMNASVVAFCFGLAFLTALGFGLFPAWQSTNVSLAGSLKEGGQLSASVPRRRLRSLLVIAETAVACVLLAGTGLVLQSLYRVFRVDPGFDTKNLLIVNINTPPDKYQTGPQTMDFYNRLRLRLESLPGVKSVGLSTNIPLAGGGNTVRYLAEGEIPKSAGDEHEGPVRSVDSNYFQTLGVPLVAGRFFDERDDPMTPPVIIINEAVAKILFPGQDPIGRKLEFTFNHSKRQVVGVIRNVEWDTLDGESKPALYTSMSQNQSGGTVVLRTGVDPLSLLSTVRREIAAIDPQAVIMEDETNSLEQMISATPSIFIRRSLTFLLSAFAIVALSLAAIGLFGVISYSVTQRTREIGIRMALGARRPDVLWLILRQGMAMTLAGAVLGVLGSATLTRLMSSVLYGATGMDMVVTVAINGVLFLVAFAACYLPARRASRVDPLVALRYE